MHPAGRHARGSVLDMAKRATQLRASAGRQARDRAAFVSTNRRSSLASDIGLVVAAAGLSRPDMVALDPSALSALEHSGLPGCEPNTCSE